MFICMQNRGTDIEGAYKKFQCRLYKRPKYEFTNLIYFQWRHFLRLVTVYSLPKCDDNICTQTALLLVIWTLNFPKKITPKCSSKVNLYALCVYSCDQKTEPICADFLITDYRLTIFGSLDTKQNWYFFLRRNWQKSISTLFCGLIKHKLHHSVQFLDTLTESNNHNVSATADLLPQHFKITLCLIFINHFCRENLRLNSSNVQFKVEYRTIVTPI